MARKQTAKKPVSSFWDIKPFKNLKRGVYQLPIAITILFLLLSWLTPLLIPRQVEATGQIEPRKLSLSTAQSNASATYTFNFTTVATGAKIDAIKLIMCTTAVGSYPGGTCTAPTNGGHLFDTATSPAISGTWGDSSTAFTIDTAGANDCVATAHIEVLCLKRSSTTNDSGGAKTLTLSTVTNATAATNGQTVFIGMTTYNANTWPSAGRLDAGTVATAIVTSLVVTASVAELLQFCVGASTADDITTADVGASCSAAPGASNTVGLGVLDATIVTISPVSTTTQGTNTNAIAILTTNAVNGSNVYYDAVQAGSGSGDLGDLRVSGATCSGTTITDQCINPKTSQGALTAGTEAFGFTIAGVSCVHEQALSVVPYACSYTAGTEHLAPQSGYIGATNAYGTGNGFQYNDAAGANTLIAAAASTNVVAYEALIMKFAATPAVTTPVGSYSVSIDYTAVPSF